MGRRVLLRMTTCSQWCGKLGLLNVCTQSQHGVYLSIYTSVYPVCGNNTQGSIIGRPLVSCKLCTWVTPPYFLNAAFAKIFIRKIFQLKVEKRHWFSKKMLFKTNTTGLIFKKSSFLRNEAIKTGYQYNFICLPANKYVHWVNEWRFNIYWESWTIFIAFQTKESSKKTRLYCLLFMYVSLRGEQVSLVRPDECFSPWCTILSSPHGITLGYYLFNLALLVFRINSRIPPPGGGRDFLDFTGVWGIIKR